MRKKEKLENLQAVGAYVCVRLVFAALFVCASFALVAVVASAQRQQRKSANANSAQQQQKKKKSQSRSAGKSEQAKSQQSKSQQAKPQPGRSQPSKPQQQQTRAEVPQAILLRILRAEDERRWDQDLATLLADKGAEVRRRAALAAGRIGDERAVAPLVTMLRTDADTRVRAMAAFALGETESANAAEALMAELKSNESWDVRARSIEALGKIAAALPKTEEARARSIAGAILESLVNEYGRRGQPDREFVLLGLTAVLRARPEKAGEALVQFLSNRDARIRADALNTMARLKAKEGAAEVRALLVKDADAVVRANAARVAGAAEDKGAFDALITRLTDVDERVRVSAIRALAALKDARSTAALLERGAKLMEEYRAARAKAADSRPAALNELLEIATALGRVLSNTWNKGAVDWLRQLRDSEQAVDPEAEIAFARIAPALYVREKPFDRIADDSARAELLKDWRRASSVAQALGEIAALKSESDGNSIVSVQADAQTILRAMLSDKNLPALAVPDVLRALAAFKPNDLAEILRRELQASDVIVRATAAELLGDTPPEEANTRALAEALPLAMRDEMNDAALSILDSLAKQKTEAANEAIKTGLGSVDHLIRRRAAALLKANGAGDFDSRIGTAQTRDTAADYQRVLARMDKRVRAVVATDKGSFTLEFLPEEAPLTVDTFVQLARRGYFNNITFHRVVPNFVIQGGDPRGDGNGGPGFQIRCEINEVPYERGAVGMALSGKDTGGSQWFVTHSPQPHLDGGYTVFARVVEGMDVVDKIARGDRIRSIAVTETARAASKVSARQPSEQKKPAKTATKPQAAREKRKGER